ncbi:DUF4124 domain-containing protein [Microbulbifer guangxiensis]|uniref:DUF4124 domain-containing protein n=1 Tax=Microbulbifer guangxiensis TaxID=2904249 RepID=UPI001F1CBD08|nr:DUF4124 domain-containing protein [Microbulbifer guangxiensis]
MFRRGLLVLSLILAGTTASADELYRWVDEHGQVHFGDRPPASASAEDVGEALTPINSADPTRATTSVRQQPVDLERQYQQQQRQQLKRQQAQRAEACRRAQRDLSILRGPVILVDESGQQVRLSERERQQKAAALEQQIRQLCG